jgi:hypothetical protein
MTGILPFTRIQTALKPTLMADNGLDSQQELKNLTSKACFSQKPGTILADLAFLTVHFRVNLGDTLVLC